VPKVEISINGRLYAVACDEGQEDRVRDLAGIVDSRVRQLTGSGPAAVGEAHLLVLAGLMLADELSETSAKIQNGNGAVPQPTPAQSVADNDQEVLIAAVDHLTDRIAVIAERLAQD
jgi:cell division protein ZapA